MDSLYSRGTYGFYFHVLVHWQFLCDVYRFQVHGNTYLFVILLLTTNEKMARKMSCIFLVSHGFFSVKWPTFLRSVSPKI